MNVRLPGGVLEDLGRESDGTLDVKVSVLGTVDEVGTDYIKFHQHFSLYKRPWMAQTDKTNTSQGA